MTSKDASDGKTRSVRTFLSIAGGAAAEAILVVAESIDAVRSGTA